MQTELARAQPSETDIAELDARTPLEQMIDVSKRVAASGFFSMTSEQVFTLMLVARSQGLPLVQGALHYHVIKGKPIMKADVRLAKFLAAGGEVEWIEYTNTIAKAKFSHPRYQPKGITLTATLEDKKADGTAMEWDDKKREFVLKSTWKRTPGSMLRATIEREAITMIMPGISAGMPSEEEAENPITESGKTPAVQSVQASLVSKLRADRDRPEPARQAIAAAMGHGTVADAVATYKEAEKAIGEQTAGNGNGNGNGNGHEPTAAAVAVSECRTWMEDTLQTFNEGILEKNPSFKTIHAAQVANHLIKKAIENKMLDPTSITRADGKRDSRLAAAAINRLWEADTAKFQSEVGEYLFSKIPPYSDEEMNELAGTEA